MLETNFTPQAFTAQRVLNAQVGALYATIRSSTIADVALAWTLCAVFYWRFRDPMVLVWLGLHFVQLLRYPLMSAYHRDPQAAQRGEFWARRQWTELLFYSFVWGLAPWLFMPADDLPMTVLLMLVMLGLSSTGVPSVAPRWASVLSFVVPMVLGLVSALVWQRSISHLFMAACGVVYLGATLYFALQQHRLLTEALVARFENEALADQLHQQMRISQRISEDKTRFLAAASHDMRQPLHAIALFGAVLQKELDGHPAGANATRLMRAVNALGKSLDSMLDISRLDAGVITPVVGPVPVNALFQALNHVFEAKASELGLQLRLRASTLWVRSDPHLLQRLLFNLVDNALKYTTQGGVLVVARARDGQVWIDVRDTGIGIPAEHLDRIFEEYYQIDNPGRDRALGLGIGLSVVQRLSGMLGHTVQVRSRPGRGTLLRVILPLADASGSSDASDAATAWQPDSSGRFRLKGQRLPQRVLIIDDEIDIRDAIVALLRVYGVHATAVADEAEAALALTQAATNGQPYEALLCDFRLARGADGLDAGMRLQNQFGPNLALLLITGETAPDKLQRIHDLNIPVIFKPASATTLLQALAERVSRSQAN